MNLKKIKDDRASAAQYAFLMLRCHMPEFVRDIQAKIPQDALYTDENDPINGFGLEQESHITILPCIDVDTSINELVKFLPDEKTIIPRAKGISVFECDKYNVLKVDIEDGSALNTVNTLLCEHFESHSEYEYHPHMTIAYLKKDFDFSQFVQEFDAAVELGPVCYDFSWPDGESYKHCYFNTNLAI
jgi:hypothetical protein